MSIAAVVTRFGLFGASRRLVPPTDMKAEEVDEATPKMLTRISKWQKDEAKYTLLVEWTNQQK